MDFYKLVRPMGKGWEHIRQKLQLAPSPDSLPHAFLGWILGCLAVYTALFSTGNFLYGNVLMGSVYLVPFLLSTGFLIWLIPQILKN
jgi:solute:Na+ symporter, SSS family